MDRREFTSASILALLSGVVVTIAGCDSDSPTAPDQDGNRAGSVSANHGHQAVVSAAQINAADQVTLDIRGSADHPHTVVLSMADVVAIGNGQRRSAVSTRDNSAAFGQHDHTVTFN
jgi:hypothetical protein